MTHCGPLFVLCMKTLEQNITRAATNKTWKPCKHTRNFRPLSHLFFADYLLLLGEALTKQVEVMKGILKTFVYLLVRRSICLNQKSGTIVTQHLGQSNLF